MNTKAPSWSAILFAPPRTYAAQPVGLKTGDRVYHALRGDTYHRTAPAEAETARADAVTSAGSAASVLFDALRQVTVKRGDVLAMQAQPGDYYWKLSRRFAKEEAVGTYAKELIAQNGGNSLVKAGQLLNLPVTENSAYTLELAIAVQKSVQLRALFGEPTPQLDWGSAEMSEGPMETFLISFKEAKSDARRRFVVVDDLSGLYPGQFKVFTEEEARRLFPELGL